MAYRRKFNGANSLHLSVYLDVHMDRKGQVAGVIPARYASSRFPGKPLAMIAGKPMIQWVYEGVKGAFDQLVVATDDRRIGEAVDAFGGDWVMTGTDHHTGTERCLEALDILVAEKGADPSIVVNIQGDEPMISSKQVEELLGCFSSNETEIATLVRPLAAGEDPADPNMVKTVLGKEMQTLYFSRAVVPHYRNKQEPSGHLYLRHIGIYGFRTRVLREVCKLPVSDLEKAESLEQLRWLENGYIIRAAHTSYSGIGVDAPGDIEKIEKLI